MGDNGRLFHYCTRSCGLYIDADPESLLALKVRIGQLERYGRSLRMAIRRNWRTLFSTLHDRNGQPVGNLTARKQASLMAVVDDLMHTARVAAQEENNELEWAVSRWKTEVGGKQLSNAYRRTLDATWRQVIERLGGDPVELCGPSHDDLLTAGNAKPRNLSE